VKKVKKVTNLEKVRHERHLRRAGVFPRGHLLHLLPLFVLNERDERVLVPGAAVHAEVAVLDAVRRGDVWEGTGGQHESDLSLLVNGGQRGDEEPSRQPRVLRDVDLCDPVEAEVVRPLCKTGPGLGQGATRGTPGRVAETKIELHLVDGRSAKRR
jgi:hypothetical protein